jgi:hypothetical protein
MVIAQRHVERMENDLNEQRFSRIESKLRLLVMLSIIQSITIVVLVFCLFIKQFMPTTLSLILMTVVLAVFFYAFRSQIPSWFGAASRFVFSQLFEAQKSNSMKDSG